MEKCAIMGAVMGALTVASTASDIKLNKQKMKLAAPGSEPPPAPDSYGYQFKTPNRSLFG